MVGQPVRAAGHARADLCLGDLDRKIDAQVERTRDRPLPLGEVTPSQALAWLLAQALIGAAVLVSFNLIAIVVGLASLLVVAIYPLMKRVTSWPQVVLGFAFNWGALLGDVVANGRVSLAALALYAGGIAWTLVYDTIYAMQDQRDDAVIGVRSTARLFADRPRAWLAMFATIAVGLWGLAGWLAALGPLYYAGLAAVALHFAWQIALLKLGDPADCLMRFKSNTQVGLLLTIALLAGRFGL